jgi:hypothetical protein
MLPVMMLPKSVTSPMSCFNFSHLVERETDDRPDKQGDNESHSDNHAANYQENLFRGHRLF